MSSLLDLAGEQARIETAFRLQSRCVGRDKRPRNILIELYDSGFKIEHPQALW